jgi:single-stranded DNA-binding protein
MIDALISGKLIKAPELKTGQSGKYYCQFLLSVSVGEDKPTIISGMALQETAEKIAKLGKGDALSVVGSLKPSQWTDKATGTLKHGLSITANASLSVYDIRKRKAKNDNPTNQDYTNNGANGSSRPKSESTVNQDYPNNGSSRPRYDHMPFNDSIPF